LVVALISTTTVPAQGRKIGPETFFDSELLREAVADIGKMPLPELRSFSRYLSECQDELENEAANHACEAARKLYHLEYGEEEPNDRAIDAWMLARNLQNRDFKLHPKTSDIVEESGKFVKVLGTIERAVHARYRALRPSKKEKGD
jgi:hypothetical protein